MNGHILQPVLAQIGRKPLRQLNAAVAVWRSGHSRWTDHNLVFATQRGGPLDAGSIRRAFRAICRSAGIGENWTPRELRTSFVSLM